MKKICRFLMRALLIVMGIAVIEFVVIATDFECESDALRASWYGIVFVFGFLAEATIASCWFDLKK